MNNTLAVFENFKIRRIYDEKTETWFFSVVDIVQALIQQPDYQAARNYWKVLKNRLNKEGSEVVTKCNRLKMIADDGKMRLTDVANPETLLRLIQSVPSPKAEPIKLWLAKVGYERIQDMSDPARSPGKRPPGSRKTPRPSRPRKSGGRSTNCGCIRSSWRCRMRNCAGPSGTGRRAGALNGNLHGPRG